MDKLIHKVKAVWDSQEGQGLVEYALILVLVSIVAIAALGLIGENVSPRSGARKTRLPVT